MPLLSQLERNLISLSFFFAGAAKKKKKLIFLILLFQAPFQTFKRPSNKEVTLTVKGKKTPFAANSAKRGTSSKALFPHCVFLFSGRKQKEIPSFLLLQVADCNSRRRMLESLEMADLDALNEGFSTHEKRNI